MFLKRILFGRVERWIDGLEPEYKTKGFIKASLGLLKVMGMPTDFSGLIVKKKKVQEHGIEHLTKEIGDREERRFVKIDRNEKLTDLSELLG